MLHFNSLPEVNKYTHMCKHTHTHTHRYTLQYAHLMGYTLKLTARDLSYALSYRQYNTYQGLVTSVTEYWLEQEI